MITIDVYDLWQKLLAKVNVSKDGRLPRGVLSKYRIKHKKLDYQALSDIYSTMPHQEYTIINAAIVKVASKEER